MALLQSASQASPRVAAALLSALFHLAFFATVFFAGGTQEGNDTGEEVVQWLSFIPAQPAERADIEIPAVVLDATELEPIELAAPVLTIGAIEEASLQRSEAVAPQVEAPIIGPAVTAPPTVTLPEADTLALLDELTLRAESLPASGSRRVTWQREGTSYSAELVLEPGQDGMDMDRVLARVSAENRGRTLITELKLKRLAFSSFAQVVDRWDPDVQMHDDEIDGRVHINSRFNVMYDRDSTPRLLGMVTTAARGLSAQSLSRRRQQEIFRGGLQTRAGRIALPENGQPFAWASAANARVHECTGDTRIRFFADGSYTWLDIETRRTEYRTQAVSQPVYFVADRGSVLYVKGVVGGSVLIYSPTRVVIEGSLMYARDPRVHADSRDYLGIVSDGYVQVAPGRITGPGDLDLHAAIFARRGFIVTDIEYPRRATLRIYGSLTAGTLSATEPRYATKLAYDARFDSRRPPGFPATNRFVLESWDGKWSEAPERTVDAWLAE